MALNLLNAYSPFSFICLLWRRTHFQVASTVFFFVLSSLSGNVDICKEANGWTSHPDRYNALYFDVNIWNVKPVYSSAWVSSDTNKTVNPFSLCVCILIWETCLCLAVGLFMLSPSYKEPLPLSYSSATAHSYPCSLLIKDPWGVTPDYSPFH